jgi:hypothetical protein
MQLGCQEAGTGQRQQAPAKQTLTIENRKAARGKKLTYATAVSPVTELIPLVGKY